MKKFFRKLNKGLIRRSFVRGFTLVEMMVAIIIFTIAILSMMVILGGGVADTNLAKNKLVASYLAQEGIEYMRNMRDTYTLYEGPTGWGLFVSKLAPCNPSSSGHKGCYFNIDSMDVGESIVDEIQITPCFNGSCAELKFEENTGTYGYTFGVGSGFYRRIIVFGGDGGAAVDAFSGSAGKEKELQIMSTVYWMQKGKLYEVTFTETLLNWINSI